MPASIQPNTCKHDVGEARGVPGGSDGDDAGEHEGGRHDAEPTRSDGLEERERPDGADREVGEGGERRRRAPAELGDDHGGDARHEHDDHPPDARVGPDPPLGDGQHGEERDGAGRRGHRDLARQQDARGGDRGEAEAVHACGPLQQALAFALHAIHRVPARSAPTPVACARCAPILGASVTRLARPRDGAGRLSTCRRIARHPGRSAADGSVSYSGAIQPWRIAWRRSSSLVPRSVPACRYLRRPRLMYDLTVSSVVLIASATSRIDRPPA